MAIARVQFGKADASGSGGSIACTVNGIAPDSLVVVNTTCQDAATISSVKDDLNVTAALSTNTPVDQTSMSQRADQHYFEDYGGGSRTITATFSASATFRAITAIEYSGAATSGVYDNGSSATGTSASPSSGAVTPANDGSLFVGYIVYANTISNAAPFTLVWEDPSTGANTEDYIQPTAASQAAVYTQSPSGVFGALVGVYKPAPPAKPLQYEKSLALQQRVG
jgi:hypothetical protein